MREKHGEGELNVMPDKDAIRKYGKYVNVLSRSESPRVFRTHEENFVRISGITCVSTERFCKISKNRGGWYGKLSVDVRCLSLPCTGEDNSEQR